MLLAAHAIPSRTGAAKPRRADTLEERTAARRKRAGVKGTPPNPDRRSKAQRKADKRARRAQEVR
ncbi:hypothetical protein CO641_02180 [Lysobacteraceae bacterium NML91-0213]|nr:hypothetical protein CO641_02180 [Xanthomonadaceae bacterium NML91-0213]